jgi:hypothetical protein
MIRGALSIRSSDFGKDTSGGVNWETRRVSDTPENGRAVRMQ